MSADSPDAERLLQELGDPLDQLVERLYQALDRHQRAFMDGPGRDAAASLASLGLDATRVLLPALAAWHRAYAGGLAELAAPEGHDQDSLDGGA
jgi:hypothetical protein